MNVKGYGSFHALCIEYTVGFSVVEIAMFAFENVRGSSNPFDEGAFGEIWTMDDRGIADVETLAKGNFTLLLGEKWFGTRGVALG